MNVLVVGDKIQKISNQTIPINSSNATRIINASGMTLMPGLIDAHVHLSAVDSISNLENKMTAEDIAVLSDSWCKGNTHERIYDST